MKRIIYLILFPLTLFAPVNSALAGDSVISESKGSLRLKTGNGGVRRNPSLLYIECEYSNGAIVFLPNFDYTYMEVVVENEEKGLVVYDVITSSNPYVDVQGEIGNMFISVQTDSGLMFEGMLYVD